MGIADIVSALLAYGLLHMRGVAGQAGWRWLFIIEVGSLPCAFSLFSPVPRLSSDISIDR